MPLLDPVARQVSAVDVELRHPSVFLDLGVKDLCRMPVPTVRQALTVVTNPSSQRSGLPPGSGGRRLAPTGEALEHARA